MINPIREIYRGLRAKRWLAAAMIVEFLGLAGAISAIPSWGLLPLIWALAAVGILSTVGVVIITAHYVLEYSRRPLNDVQRVEVGGMLSDYLTTEEAQSLAPKAELQDFAPKTELQDLVAKHELFWLLQYQKSVLELAWATDELFIRPGTMLVAELVGAGSVTAKVEFSLVPPPVENVGECLTDAGENPPRLYQDWGTIFDQSDQPVVFYVDSRREIRYLHIEHRAAFNDHLAAPVLISWGAKTKMPVLVKTQREVARPRREWPYEWVWQPSVDM